MSFTQIGRRSFNPGLPSGFPSGGLPGSVPGGLPGRSPLDLGPVGGMVANAVCDRITDRTLRELCKAGGSIFTGGGGFAPGGTTNGNCPPGQVRVGGGPCKKVDPTPTTVTPGEASTGARGFRAPMRQIVERLQCTHGDVVYRIPATGELLCLPRKGGTAIARSLGAVRLHKPRRKPYISAAEIKLLDKIDKVQRKAKDFAKKAGLKTVKRGR